MSETAEDRDYFAAAEAAFIRRRGTPFLLSPKDFALLKQWRELGVPGEAIEEGIEEAFSRREERGATGRVNSLAYCRDAVLEAWERRSGAAVGRGSGRGAAVDPAAALALARKSLEALGARRADLLSAVEPALAALARLEKRGKTLEETERSLARIDRRLASALGATLPEAERERIDRRVEELIGPVRARMDADTAEKTRSALSRRVLREMLELPRLTLL
jgi:hypothetical protein